ncbi:MAG: hypothetical protein IPK60_22755 [Sandaracinaceae bacterium]|nr:hypothetical protein [Sandaracinaceae bacterium]
MTKEQLASILEAHADRYQLRTSQSIAASTGDVNSIGHAIRAEILDEVGALLKAIAKDLRGMG